MSDLHPTRRRRVSTRARRPGASAAVLPALMLGAALGLQGAPATAQAQADAFAQSGARRFDVPAGTLENALNALARQAGITLSVDAALVRGKPTAALAGSFSVQQALARLLAGSGLVAVAEGGVVVVRAAPAPAAAAGEDAETTLPPVRASAARQEANAARSVTAGLLPLRPSMGTARLAADIREQAQVIQIVPRALMEDRNVLSVHEALDTVAGVRPVSPAYSSRSAGIRSRGFENDDSFYNGFRFAGFGVPVESAHIESVEVLKGPASLQFGLTAPGGALNIVTKRPVARPLASAKLTLGSDDTARVDLDLGGALDEGERLRTRLNVSAETNEQHRDFDRNRRFAIAPALSWQAGADTTVELELNYLHNEYRFNRGLPPRPFILDLPRRRSLGEPNQPLSTNETVNAFYTLTHRLGDGRWSLRQRAGYLRTDSDSHEVNVGVNDIDAAGRLARNYIASTQKERSWTVQHELTGSFTAAGIAQRLLVGVEVGSTGREYGFREVADPAQDLPPLNVFAPAFGGYVFPPAAALKDSYPAEGYGNRYRALYADWQGQLSAQWRLLAGARLDRTRGHYRPLDGSADYAAADSRGLSPRVGVVWTPLPQLDLFANYSTGFQPNLFADAAGNLFDTPEKSRQLELGLRHELIPERLRATASVFSIAKRNIQTPDPADPTGNRSVLTGEQKSDGLELELTGALTAQWDVTLGYAYTRARTTRHSDPEQVGLPLVDAPRHHVTAWNKVRFGGAAAPWWAGWGLTWVDERRSSNANAAFLLPSYVRHDLALGYAAGPWAAQLNLGNVTDERVYFTHGNNIHLQPGRNLRASLQYRFF